MCGSFYGCFSCQVRRATTMTTSPPIRTKPDSVRTDSTAAGSVSSASRRANSVVSAVAHHLDSAWSPAAATASRQSQWPIRSAVLFASEEAVDAVDVGRRGAGVTEGANRPRSKSAREVQCRARFSSVTLSGAKKGGDQLCLSGRRCWVRRRRGVWHGAHLHAGRLAVPPVWHWMWGWLGPRSLRDPPVQRCRHFSGMSHRVSAAGDHSPCALGFSVYIVTSKRKRRLLLYCAPPSPSSGTVVMIFDSSSKPAIFSKSNSDVQPQPITRPRQVALAR